MCPEAPFRLMMLIATVEGTGHVLYLKPPLLSFRLAAMRGCHEAHGRGRCSSKVATETPRIGVTRQWLAMTSVPAAILQVLVSGTSG